MDIDEILGVIDDPILAVDRDWRIVFANAATLAAGGQPADMLLGRDLWEAFPVLRGSPLEAAYRRAMDERCVVTMALPGLLSGRFFDIAVHPAAAGGLVIHARDVDERRRAAEALRQSEAEYRQVFELAAVGKAQVEPATGRFLIANRRFCEITGYDEAELRALTFADITHPEDRDVNAADWRAQVDGGAQAFFAEKRYVRKDGEVVWVSVHGAVVRDQEGRPVRSLADVLDVTARRRSEEALREAREQLEARVAERTAELAERSRMLDAFFRHSLTPVVFLDPSFRFVRVNEAYARECGRPASDFPGLNHFDLYPDDENRSIFDEVVRTREPAQFVAKPFAFPDHPEWGVTWWDWELVPILDAAGEVELLIFSLENVTARERTQQELRASYASLSHRATQLRALATDLTEVEQRERKRISRLLHDHVQQMLVAARLHLSLDPDRASDAVRRRAVAQADDRVEQALQVLKSLTVELTPPVLGAEGLAAGLQWLAHRVEENHGLAVRTRMDRSVEPASESLRLFLYEAVRELLFNVVKHAGTREAELSLEAAGGAVRVEVADRGSGFDPGVEGSWRYHPGGIGLLGIRERLDLLGGRMEIDSRPQGGTRVVLLAPLQEPAGSAGG